MIEVRDLKKKLGANMVLDGVSLRIETGESVVIIGRSGCGKSVLLKHIIGLFQPDSGSVKIDGEEISRLNERQLLRVRSKFGMLFQGAALFDSMTVAENVAFGLEERKVPKAEIKTRVAEALESVRMGQYAERKPNQLSGGQQQLVAVARAVITNPKLILADEPTGNLHSTQGKEIMELFKRLNDEGTTIIQVTHSEVNAAYGRRVINLVDGWMEQA
jgi:ABC-type lipoprotein export system ATPase subunit